MSKVSLEDMLDSLDNCVKELEREDISLEESFKLYEKGIKLVQACNECIDGVEKDVLKLEADGTMTVLEDIN